MQAGLPTGNVDTIVVINALQITSDMLGPLNADKYSVPRTW